MLATSIFMLFLLATTSCNEPSLIGADVIDSDRPDVVFTDTLTLFTSSVRDDSIRTFDDLNLLTTYLCGNFEDPIFGISEAEINTQLRLTGTPDPANFTKIPGGNAKLDSVVFVLEYDPDQFFGNSTSLQEVGVYLLDEDMDNNVTYYSNDDFAAGDLLTSAIVNPSEPDSAFSIIGTSGDTIYPPQLRLSIDVNHPLFTDILFKDDSSIDYYQNDTSLLNVLKGVKVVVENSPPTDLMMAFRLSSSSLGGMYMYYHTLATPDDPSSDTLSYRFRINNDAAQMVNFKHTYENSFVQPYIDTLNDETDGEQYIFVQGMQGLNGKIRIPYTSGLKNAIINQAKLELTIATMVSGDIAELKDNPLEQLFLSKKDEDGDLVPIADLQVAFGGNLVGIFGGNLVEKTENNMILQTYTMNVTEHLQDMINGLESTDEIFITTFAKAQSANRSIIFGTGHPTYPPKLNVTYTINQ